MTHPTSQLAEYVDGTLASDQRRSVEAHLRSCNRCVSEVAAAKKARDALTSLGEVAAPAGVTSPILREAREVSAAGTPERKTSARGAQTRQGSRYVGLYKVIAAAAAALVAGVLVFASLHSGQPEDQLSAGSAAPDFMDSHDNEAGPLDRDGNYSASELQALAQRLARSRTQGLDASAPGYVSGAPRAVSSPTTAASPAPASSASSAEWSGTTSSAGKAAQVNGSRDVSNTARFGRCLDQIGAYDHGGVLVDSFEARYLDIPAYFAALTEGPDAGQPADRVVIWVLGKGNCDVLAFSQERFPLATPSPLPTSYLNP